MNIDNKSYKSLIKENISLKERFNESDDREKKIYEEYIDVYSDTLYDCNVSVKDAVDDILYDSHILFFDEVLNEEYEIVCNYIATLENSEELYEKLENGSLQNDNVFMSRFINECLDKTDRSPIAVGWKNKFMVF